MVWGLMKYMTRKVCTHHLHIGPQGGHGEGDGGHEHGEVHDTISLYPPPAGRATGWSW